MSGILVRLSAVLVFVMITLFTFVWTWYDIPLAFTLVTLALFWSICMVYVSKQYEDRQRERYV